ncbi:unnamed protein product [Heligmosomoides polygyrus]|uniref:Phage protein n=1 Tax=Heligmosomoides polygyrus TaxID=6339 RepID=A0A183FZD5_HELPZ|nr:unnamed protein product [Heligmosomoides polygyrus]
MALFERIEYSGAMEMLHNDLLEALDTEIAIVRRKGYSTHTHASWLNRAIEDYLAANSKQLRCARRDAIVSYEYEIEKVPEGGAARSPVGPRTITVSSYYFSPEPFSSRDGVNIAVENFF